MTDKTVKSFEELNIWRNARELVRLIYQFTKTGKLSKEYSFADQLKRASVSIMSNIAEGFERGSNKEFVQFLYISKGSCSEVRSLLYVALDQKYITEEEFSKTRDECLKLSGMINNFIKYLVPIDLRRQKH